ncbi:ClpXP protease specificity-enhancing factor [Bowmanella yangjiangensis]|uniref:ClpXP protease specificity-enhancing factor n=1 Tax=Bowmanella yangjiangensis TaxID=2811230 RepID=A0ABS3CY98_9ALTE|nr:ClpXP protease specificity-enhancing factor [Bowmanella yangjiangensis]MBN7821086.1 ClpXP protease specificity-enhancing factor [Bowmanella yangjiangensis]
MAPNKPYLLRAFYEWIVDNDLTPHLVVDATVPGTLVPQEHVRDGQIVLNISPSACGKLQLGNSDVTFDARFGGVARRLEVPLQAVLAIYARENGAGTIFSQEEGMDDLPPEPTPPPQPAKGRPQLKVVK